MLRPTLSIDDGWLLSGELHLGYFCHDRWLMLMDCEHNLDVVHFVWLY